jgi:hypothetical protein
MKYCPEKHGNPVDWTEFDVAMTNGPMFVCATGLIVFRIVQEDTKYLAEQIGQILSGYKENRCLPQSLTHRHPVKE